MAGFGIFAGGLAKGLQNLPEVLLALRKANEAQKLRQDVLLKNKEEEAARIEEQQRLQKDISFLLKQRRDSEDQKLEIENILGGGALGSTPISGSPPGIDVSGVAFIPPAPPEIKEKRKLEALSNVLMSGVLPASAKNDLLKLSLPDEEGKQRFPAPDDLVKLGIYPSGSLITPQELRLGRRLAEQMKKTPKPAPGTTPQARRTKNRIRAKSVLGVINKKIDAIRDGLSRREKTILEIKDPAEIQKLIKQNPKIKKMFMLEEQAGELSRLIIENDESLPADILSPKEFSERLRIISKPKEAETKTLLLRTNQDIIQSLSPEEQLRASKATKILRKPGTEKLIGLIDGKWAEIN